jgi:glycerophosphoryl diester phosphodiesterase
MLSRPFRLRAFLGLLATACAGHNPRPSGHLFPAPQPTIIGHRGAARLAPENTMAAFRVATDLGLGFELDVTLSEDGELVVIHDDTLERTTTGSGAVAEHRWTDLSSLDAGSWFGTQYAGEPIPRLPDVLAELGHRAVINVEIKTPPKGTSVKPVAEAVVRELQKAGLTQRAFVTSFNPFVLEAVRAADPSIIRGQLVATFDEADLSGIEKLVLKNLWLNRKASADLLVAEAAFLRRRGPRYVRAMKRRGYRVLVWTVNDPAEMREMVELGADGIITDSPDVGLQTMHPVPSGS